MKITFVRPNLRDTRSRDAMEPLSIAILQAHTPSDVETAFYDERLEEIPFDEPTDLVALTVETYTARRAYQIAAQFRVRGVPVVMGGYHPTFLPEEALRYADAVVEGDAEGAWGEVVADARGGALRRRYRAADWAPLDGAPPDRSIFGGKRYAPVAMVQYGRGCRFHCEFCSIRAFYGDSLRQRPVRDVVEEIERRGRRHVFFVDDNIFVDVPKAKELFRALVPLGITWSCQVSIDIAADEELLRLMQRSGCTTAVVGFESLEVKNLRQMKKAWNLKLGSYDTSIRALRNAGIMIYGTFVFGYDQDTPDAFDAAVDFALENRFYLANFNPLTPTPGAPLFDRLKREGRLIHDAWWLDPSFRYGDATFHPRGMTADELTEGCFRARSRFYELSSIGRRLLDVHTHLRRPYRIGLYLASNLISRHEIKKKQGARLGADTPLVPDLELALG